MRLRVRRPSGAGAWALSFALLAALSAMLVANRDVLNQRQAPVALTLLMVVLLGSVTAGRALGLSLALTGFLVINYWFQLPYGRFAVHEFSDWLVLLSFVAAADLASRLLARAQREAREAQRRAAEVQRLADLGAETLAAPLSHVALQGVADEIARTLRLDRCELWDLGARDAAPRRVAVSRGASADAAREPSASPDPPAPLDGSPADWRAAEPTIDDPDVLARLADPVLRDRIESAEEAARRFDAILDGAPRDALVPLVAHRRVVGALRLARADGLALDASERTFLQALAHYAALGVERARLAAELKREIIRRETDRMRDFLLAAVSHDLRTPLTTIKMLAHQGARAGDATAALIEEQADRLTRMVTDALDLSRARAGALPLSPDLNTAEDVVGATLRHVNGALRGHAVETRLDSGSGALVGRFDFVATLRILGNVIENAAKYSPDGAPIGLEVVRDGDAIRFSVADRGPGVAESERDQIFAPFHRASGRPPDVGGTGLGLAVARTLAEAQGGSLAYASREGGGSVFTLHVPASHDARALDLIGGTEPIAPRRG